MKKITAGAGIITLMPAGTAFATNGDNMMGIGGISRAMGGTGLVAPQDTITGSYFNSAVIGSYDPKGKSDFDFAATLFAPHIEGRVQIDGRGTAGRKTQRSGGAEGVYTVPAFGFSTQASDRVRLALSAFGCSGLGVDHRDSSMSGGRLAADSTQLIVLKVAPAISYRITDDLTVGLALQVVNAQLDLNQGTSGAYSIGGQAGAVYRVTDTVSGGLSYQTPITTGTRMCTTWTP